MIAAVVFGTELVIFTRLLTGVVKYPSSQYPALCSTGIGDELKPIRFVVRNDTTEDCSATATGLIALNISKGVPRGVLDCRRHGSREFAWSELDAICHGMTLERRDYDARGCALPADWAQGAGQGSNFSFQVAKGLVGCLASF